ncbi:MAG: TonB-dependent receptor, partial [Rhodoferax sp.]|nr:TonB-dependent receptor [Rhodoferax sp.]
MAIRSRAKFSPTAAALALLFAPLAAQAQSSPQSLKSVTVVGKSAPVLDAEQAEVGGFGLSLGSTPQGISVLGADLLAATGTASLSQALKLDASLADSYNTTGYVESLSVRGFLLDQGNNFLRNGLPSSNFAPLALENKERIEVLKGVSGLQAGVSAPGGLLNFVSKQPLQEPSTQVVAGADGHGGSKVHLDTNARWGPLGVRVNLATESLRTHFDQAAGQRTFASVALATALTPDTSVSAELEVHRKRQPSVPGLGLRDTNGDGLGDSFPLRIDPRLNLNNQAWSSPFESTTAAAQLAVKHRLNANWQAQFAVGVQRIHINDRLAFPDGCSSAANYVYPGLCANGDVDIYDYRSEGEERSVDSWSVRLNGKLSALGTTHQLLWGLGGHRSRLDLQPLQAYNYVGTTNIDLPIALPADPTPTELNTPTRENVLHSTVSLVTDLGPQLKSFAGLRVSQVARNSARSDGSRAVALDQSVSTPWVGLAWTVRPSTLVYASWGQGAELEVVPNRSNRFVNYGQVLPALKSEQT